MNTRLSFALVLAALLLPGAITLPDPALAHQSEAEPAAGVPRFAPTLRVEMNYDSNVFLLGPGKKSDLSSPSSSDQATARFSSMESASDLIATLRLEGGLDFRGLASRSFTVAPTIRYDLYTRNRERSNLRIEFNAAQDLAHGGRIGLGARFTPSYFAKNYLADAVDLDGSGTISADEHRYRAGTYNEGEVALEYRVRLAKGDRDHPVGAKLKLEAGYFDRSYAAPFRGRDVGGPTGAAGLLFALSRRTSVDLAYEASILSADESPEVLLLDEPDFGLDFNGNGSYDDLAVRTVQIVDRSRTEHSLEARMEFDLAKSTHARLSYEHRLRHFSSDQPLDVLYRERRDTRNTVGLDLRIRLPRGLGLALGGEFARQSTNRAGDPSSSGEEDDYSRARTHIKLAYRL